MAPLRGDSGDRADSNVLCCAHTMARKALTRLLSLLQPLTRLLEGGGQGVAAAAAAAPLRWARGARAASIARAVLRPGLLLLFLRTSLTRPHIAYIYIYM